MKNFENSDELPEHRLKLISYKGSPSLNFPLILSPIQKTDDEETINKKIETVIRFIDAFGVFRMLLDEPITHSSIRNAIYIKVKEIRNIEINNLLPN
ncbi:MAG: hypothetical protein IPN13_12150 [Bacteroidetes bacterium]|nr:hypothetical protein [Bacteroidota bacterium]